MSTTKRGLSEGLRVCSAAAHSHRCRAGGLRFSVDALPHIEWPKDENVADWLALRELRTEVFLDGERYALLLGVAAGVYVRERARELLPTC